MKGFVVATDSYAGNFERQLCAYITGIVGDCGVGEHEADTYPMVEGTIQQPDDNHCMRPCAIYPTPGYYNNGMGFAFVDGQEELALAEWKQSWISMEEQFIETEEGHRGKNINTWTDEAIDSSIANRMKKIDEVRNTTEVSKYSSYQSVIIFFEDNALTEDLIDILKVRALEYAGSKNITIENFNIVEL